MGMDKASLKASKGQDLGTELVPIRLNVKIQGRHIQESFCIDPSAEESYLVHMVKQLCFETQLSRQCEQPLYKIIKERIHNFKEVASQLESSGGEETIETIRLNFQLGKILVKDQFLWDIMDPDASPEAFAEVMCKDLKLPRTFVPEISCRIREQIIDLRASRKKDNSLNLPKIEPMKEMSGKDHERPMDSFGESDSQPRSIYSLPSVRKRNEWEEWSPHVQDASEEDCHKLEVRTHKKSRLAVAHSTKPDGSSGAPGFRDLEPHLSHQGGGTSMQQQTRSRVSQGSFHDGPQHLPMEALTPSCIPPAGPLAPPNPIHHPHHSISMSRARNSAGHPVYGGSIQGSLTGQWTPQSSMGRLSMNSTPGPHANGMNDQYLHMETLQAQQPDAMSQGNMGSMMGPHYPNNSMMGHFQNGHGHTQMQPPTNGRGWVINQSYDHIYR